MILIEHFFVYTNELKGFAAVVGTIYEYADSELKKTLCGKIAKPSEPQRRIAISMEHILQHCHILKVCSHNCKVINGKLLHQHQGNLILVMKIV
jgi:hypothetical protein